MSPIERLIRKRRSPPNPDEPNRTRSRYLCTSEIDPRACMHKDKKPMHRTDSVRVCRSVQGAYCMYIYIIVQVITR